MSIIHITGSGYTEQNDQDNWAAEYLSRKLNLHKELEILDHPDGSVTKAKLSNALQRDIDNTADTADTALDLAGDNEAAINVLKSRLTADEKSAAETKKTADNAEKQSGYALATAMSNSKNIGALSELETSDKTNLVYAINELKSIDDSLSLEHIRIFGTIDNAQTAADNAQTTAENAQTAAEKAQQTAENAQQTAENTQTNPIVKTAIDEITSINTIYDLGVQTELTMTLPSGQVGNFIEVDFISGETATRLAVNSSNGLIGFDLIPGTNTIYTLYFEWGATGYDETSVTYGWRFNYSEYSMDV